MSVLDDAQQLLYGMNPGCQGMCLFCYGTESPLTQNAPIEHKPGCVYLRRGRIVAALEALQEIANGGETPDAALARRALDVTV
jgi:hypothetical protein